MPAGDVSQAMLGTVRFRIGEPAESNWSNDEIYNYLNEAQMAIVHEEGLDAVMLPVTEIRNGIFAAADFTYDLPLDFLRERYATLGGVLCRRMEILDQDALRANVFFAPTKTNPFYSIQDGLLTFHTGAQDPDSLVYKLYYVRKPMRVRTVTSQVGATITVASHGLTLAENENDGVVIEDATVVSGPDYNGQVQVITAVPTAGSLTVSVAAAQNMTGGRMIHTRAGQIASDEDPLLGPIFYGLIMDWAVARCWEQGREWDERDRQMSHFRQRMEVLKQHYGAGRPYDNVSGDPGRRQAAAGG